MTASDSLVHRLLRDVYVAECKKRGWREKNGNHDNPVIEREMTVRDICMCIRVKFDVTVLNDINYRFEVSFNDMLSLSSPPVLFRVTEVGESVESLADELDGLVRSYLTRKVEGCREKLENVRENLKSYEELLRTL